MKLMNHFIKDAEYHDFSEFTTSKLVIVAY